MWRALGAVLAATAGTAFLSGRQLTLFFSQLGGMSWLAVGTASALFGLCCGALCRFARQTGGENVAAVLMRRLDPRTGAAAGAANALVDGVLDTLRSRRERAIQVLHNSTSVESARFRAARP